MELHKVLNVISWNIQGINTRLQPRNVSLSNSKLKIRSVIKTLSAHDIIFLQETWLVSDDLVFPGFSVTSSIRKSTGTRGHGGVSLLIRSTLKDHIKPLKSTSPNILWCHLSAKYFGFTSDVFIANVYLPPINSQKKSHDDDLQTLENEINKYSNLGHIVLVGDFNARTGLLKDFIENDCQLINTHLNDFYTADKMLPNRNNQDIKLNKQGEEMIKFCIGNKLRILNGRKTGDLVGKFTSFQPRGTSTIDYGIVNEAFWKDILTFKVHPLIQYSDHCPISLKIAANYKQTNKKIKHNSKPTNTNKIIRFSWSHDSIDNFTQALCQDVIKDKLELFLSSHYSSVTEEVNSFNNIIQDIGKLSLKVRKVKRTKEKDKKWYDKDCHTLKKKLKSILKQLNSNKVYCNNLKQKLRIDYFTVKKQYKRLIKKKHREYKNNIFQKIQSLDPNLKGDFWKLLDALRKSKTKESNNISSEEWISHFKNLLFDNNQQNIELNTLSHDVNNEAENLNNNITVKEIHEHISKLKMNKATGLDGIHNEMLKHGRFYLVHLFHKLFNNVFLQVFIHRSGTPG